MEEKAIEFQPLLQEVLCQGSCILSQSYNDLTFQSSLFCCVLSIGIHRSTEIFGDLHTKFCQKFDFLAIMRLLNVFKSQNCAWAARQAVYCIDHHISLALKTSQSRTDLVKSLKTALLVWHSGVSFGLTPFGADFIDYVECAIDVKYNSKLNKVICLVTTLHKFTATNEDLFYIHALSYHLT